MKQNTIIASCIGAIAAIILTVAITIGGELYAPLKDWLKTTFTHHWLGKSVISVAVFAVILFITKFLPVPESEERIARLISILALVAILGTFSLIGFYTYEYLIYL